MRFRSARSPATRDRSRRGRPVARASADPGVLRRIGLLAALLAATSAAAGGGDPARGERLYESRCGACHSLDANRVGPAHQGIIGRKAGSVADYDYSPAVKAATLVWTPATLERWLADPEKTIPGQKMGYSVPDARDRADLIAWLASR
jgi:cytochrome c